MVLCLNLKIPCVFSFLFFLTILFIMGNLGKLALFSTLQIDSDVFFQFPIGLPSPVPALEVSQCSIIIFCSSASEESPASEESSTSPESSESLDQELVIPLFPVIPGLPISPVSPLFPVNPLSCGKPFKSSTEPSSYTFFFMPLSLIFFLT